MAHDVDTRRAVRAAYVFDNLTLELAAIKGGVPFATVKNWKRAAKEAGDDWDKARAANNLAGGGIEEVLRQTLAIVVRQVQSVMEQIDTTPDMSPQTKIELLASVTDSYNKLMALSRRLMPETDKFAVATDVVTKLMEFTRKNHPKHAMALLEVVEPFGEELAKAYG